MITTSTFTSMVLSILLSVALIVLASRGTSAGRRWLIPAIALNLVFYVLVILAPGLDLIGFLLRNGSKLSVLIWVATCFALVMYVRERRQVAGAER